MLWQKVGKRPLEVPPSLNDAVIPEQQWTDLMTQVVYFRRVLSNAKKPHQNHKQKSLSERPQMRGHFKYLTKNPEA